MIGALVIGTYDCDRLVSAGKVGTGFTERMRRELEALMRPLPGRRARSLRARCRARRGSSSRDWCARSSSSSGPLVRANSGTPRSRDCASTKTSARLCARARPSGRSAPPRTRCARARLGRQAAWPRAQPGAVRWTPAECPGDDEPDALLDRGPFQAKLLAQHNHGHDELPGHSGDHADPVHEAPVYRNVYRNVGGNRLARPRRPAVPLVPSRWLRSREFVTACTEGSSTPRLLPPPGGIEKLRGRRGYSAHPTVSCGGRLSATLEGSGSVRVIAPLHRHEIGVSTTAAVGAGDTGIPAPREP